MHAFDVAFFERQITKLKTNALGPSAAASHPMLAQAWLVPKWVFSLLYAMHLCNVEVGFVTEEWLFKQYIPLLYGVLALAEV